MLLAVTCTEDIDPITDTGKKDDATVSSEGDDAVNPGKFLVCCRSFYCLPLTDTKHV